MEARGTRRAKKAVAIAVCSSLILTAPGLPVYEALAAKIVVPRAAANGSATGTAGIPVQAIRNVNTALGSLTPAVNANLTAVLPAVGNPAVGVTPSLEAAKEVRVKDVKGVASTSILKRVESAEKAGKKTPRGLFNILVDGIRGKKDAESKESRYLSPSKETLGSASTSKSWGAKSFDALRGMENGISEADAVEMAPNSGAAPLRSGLRPAGSISGRAAKTMVPAAQPQQSKKGMTALFGGAAVMGLGALSLGEFSLSGAWSTVTEVFSAINIFSGLSWPAMIGIQLALGLTMHFGKKWWKKRKAKQKEEKEKQEALTERHPVTLEKDAALVAVARAAQAKQKLNIFNFMTTSFHEVDAEAEILQGVNDGAYTVTTDDTGVLYLVPNINGAETAEAKAEEQAAKEAEEAVGAQEDAAAEAAENAAMDAEEAIAPLAFDASAAPAAPTVEPEPSPFHMSKAAIYGTMLGTALAFAAALVYPTAALFVPLISWVVGDRLLNGKVMQETEISVGSLYGVAAGTAAAYLAFAVFGAPLTAALALPLAGSAIGFVVEGWLRGRWAKAKKEADRLALEEMEGAAASSAEEAVEDDQVVAEPAPVEETAPVEEPVPAKKAAPVEKKAPVRKQEPVARKGANPSGLAGASPRSFRSLPADARSMKAETLAQAKAKAQIRARRIAKDARLVRVAINLNNPSSRWIFIFHSPKKKKILTVYSKRIVVKPQGKSPLRTKQTLWNSRLASIRSIEDAYTALKQDSHWFKPVRVEIISRWKQDPIYTFIDARGRIRKVAAVLRDDAPGKSKDQPGTKLPAPPKETPPPSKEKPGDEARAPPGDIAKPPSEETSPKTPNPKENSPHIHEGLFGFRSVRGIKHDPHISRLSDSADAPQIISYIARQFNIPHAELMAMAEDYGLSMTSDRAAWLAVYDELQRMNREEFKQLDSKKYEGGLLSETVSRLFVKLGWRKKVAEAGYRKLANRQYPKGLSGALVRALEMHKHLIGIFVRFPYQLFDMFFFGFFRRNITYEFSRSTEDFITLRAQIARKQAEEKGELTETEEMRLPTAEKWIKGAMAKHQRRGVGLKENIYAGRGARLLRRYFLTPVFGPLVQFVWRRATLAIFSAVAMGLIAGLTPLPVLSFHLTAVPFLGDALVAFGHGLPLFLSAVPFVGESLAAVTGSALNAVISDLSVGALLNTFALSTLLTFPAVAKQRLMDQRGMAHRLPPLLSADFILGVAGTAISWSFWSKNLKSMFGLMVVGAEIEGVMSYAGEIDGFFNTAYQPLTGSEFRLFHTIGAAVERPEGDSPIPFGGAITWGNILIYKLQDLAGFNITDAVYNVVRHGVYGVHGLEPGSAIEVAMAGNSTPLGPMAAGQSVVASIVGMASRGGGGPEGFVLGARKEMEARKLQAQDEAGDLEREITRVKQRIAELEATLLQKTQERDQLKEMSLSPAEAAKQEAEYRAALEKLESKRDEDYVQGKLAEIFDLQNPADDPASRKEYEAQRIAKLTELQAYYASLLGTEVNQSLGYSDSLGLRKAVLESLAGAVERYRDGTSRRRPDLGAVKSVDQVTEKRLESMVSELEDLRGEVKGDLVNRDALAKLFAVINRSRDTALRDRRGGKEMLEFHKNLAKLATVMDLALSLNEVAAAQAAIKQMEQMLDAKLQKIRQTREQAERDLRDAETNDGRNEEWERDAEGKIADSARSKTDMEELESQTRSAVENIGAFRTEAKALLGRIDAEDAGQSPNALAEYQRRKALLPELVKWYTDGKPGDEDFLSLKELNSKLADVQGYVDSVDEGLDKIRDVPVEFAGVLVIAVPGVPDVSVNNPSEAQTLQILADRKAHWLAELEDYKETRDEFRNRQSATYSGLDTDDFGDFYPLSLPKRLAQAESDIAKHSADARGLLTRMDREAAYINQYVPGAALPALSGMSLEQLKDAVQAYKDQLKTLSFPSDTSNEIAEAKMSLLKIAQLLPQAARSVVLWAKADAQVEPIQDALRSPVPQAVSVYDQGVSVIQELIADIDKDIADVKAGFPDKQGLIDRKKALLEKVRPILLEAKGMITGHAIPFQNDSIESFDPNGDTYAKLFQSQIDLYEGTKETLERTVPWSLASNGAKEGDAADGMAKIQKQRERFLELLNGYDNADGHHDGVNELLSDLERRKDPNNNDSEEIYGRVQPYSLPKAIAQNQAEKVKRSQQINAKHAEINDIFDRIERLTNGEVKLSQYRLPTNIAADGQASVDAVQRLVDDGIYYTLGDLLTDIGNEYKNKGDPVLDMGDREGVPEGKQPDPTLDNNTTIALMALEAAKRLVPSTNQVNNVDDGSAAYAVAEFLFADGFIDGASKNLYERIPVAEVFLKQAQAGLNTAIADLQKDEAYVRADGASETSDQVFDRKLAIYGQLNALTRAGVGFYGQKVGWDTEGLDTVKRVKDFYEAQKKIHDKAVTAADSEEEAILKFKDALKETYDDLEEQRVKLTRWMSQLNDPHESALRRVADNLRELQDKTRAVLEQNLQYHDIKARYERANDSLDYSLRRADKVQRALARELRELRDPGGLSPALAKRIQDLRINGGMYMMEGLDTSGATAALVVPKKDFGSFVETLFTGFLERASSGVNLAGLQKRLLEDPSQISSIIPNTEMLEFGDADGFYLVYQSQFSVPHGLETSNWVTLGNVAKLWGNNISVTGYQFASPVNDENAPWGDKGVEVQVESLQGKNWVNYLNIDFHRFIQNIPADTQMTSQAQQSRMMVFDDFAMMLFDGKLYIGLAGFADIATSDTKNKPSYYGGSIKTEWKFHEVMSLSAEQQRVAAKDPRYFLQTMNLDFTGLDPDLNRDFVIEANGENKDYKRTQIGPKFNVAKLLKSEETFSVDLFWARVEGTDDYNQDSVGVTVLKGFTIKDDKGKPWMIIQNRAGFEKGERFGTLSDRVSVTLPNWGVVVNAEGRLVGDAKTYFLELAKKTGDHSNISLSYGSRYVGQEPRLTIGLNSAFTLGELWSAVTRNTADALEGSSALKKYNRELDGFLKDEAADAGKVKELRSVFLRDIGTKLIKQDIGNLTKEIEELRKAGAFLDNTRVRGMVGFTTNPIGDDLSDRVVGGGFAAGTHTTMELSKTQKALIEAKVQNLYRESLRLQFRMLELTRQWQQTVVDIAQAQWELKMAHAMAEHAPTEALRREGAVLEAEAELRLQQASIRYNMLSGRDPKAALPFDNLSAGDVQSLLSEIKSIIATPDRMVKILHMLDKEEIAKEIGDNPFNLVDWIPWVDKLTFSFGAQFHDYMANQVLGLGVTIRLPIYDPASKEHDKAYILESQATVREIEGVWQEYSLRAAKERQRAEAWFADADNLAPGARKSQLALDTAIKAYRNGLIGEKRMREAFDQWHWYVAGILESESKGMLAAGWSVLDRSFGRAPTGGSDPLLVDSFQDAFNVVSKNARSLEEVGLREQAAAHRTAANDHRIKRFYIDLFAGYNLTADGVGWLPSFGVTGLAVTPILTFELKPEELRELQTAQGRSEEKYFNQFKTKVEADLALDIYRHVVAIDHAGQSVQILEGEIIPELRRQLAAAQRDAAKGDPEGNVPRLQRELDIASRRLIMARQIYQQSFMTLNYLMGRPEGAPLDMELTPQKALADLKAILAKKEPAAADKAILDSRVEVARAVEQMVDKDLKLQQVRVEPVSLVVRSLGRLLSALSDEGIGNPERVAAARIQTLDAERARDAYDRARAVSYRQVQAELKSAESALARLNGRTDPESRLRAVELNNKLFVLKANLARLGAEPEDAVVGTLPASYRDLTARVMDAEQDLASAGREADIEVFAPELLEQKSSGYARYYRARTSLGGDPIGENYIDTWVEVRLRDPETPAEVLLALAKLRVDKATRINRNMNAAARSSGQILLSEFETNVRLQRWAESMRRDPRAEKLADNLDQFRSDINDRLAIQADRIKALLGLPRDVTPAQLARLVPADQGGDSGDLGRIAARFISQVEALNIDQIRRTLFDGGIPAALGSEDGLIHQIRADVIAERMSYNGFTPVAAFGIFRARSVGAFYMEAPDPRSIERGLEQVLSESLRKELMSQGRMQELAQQLHLLMNAVAEKSKLVEKQHRLILAAADEFQASLARFERGMTGAAELASSQQALVDALLEFSKTVAELKNDFIKLVTELEAIGFPAQKLIVPSARALELAGAEKGRTEQERMLSYASRRVLDAGFAQRLLDKLATLRSLAPEARRDLDAASSLYRMIHEAAEAARYHPEIDAAHKLEVLTKLDAEGRRLQVEGVLGRIFAALSVDPAGRTEFLNFLMQDIEGQITAADGAVAHNDGLLMSMREAYADSLDLPFALQGAVMRLEKLYRARLDAKQTLLEDYMLNLRGAADFIMRDIALDTYLKAEAAYDAEVLKTYEHESVAGDSSMIRYLASLYPPTVSIERAKSELRFGRAMPALEALIMLEEGRLKALRYEHASARDINEVLNVLGYLQGLRERWLARDPGELSPLYAVTEVVGDRRLWTTQGWFTQEDVNRLLEAKQIHKDADGRMWLLDGKRRLEVIGGVDSALGKSSSARRALDGNTVRLQLHKLFATSEFALVRLDGAGVRAFSYEEALAVAVKGAMFSFTRDSGRYELHPARHPLKALWSDPANTETVLYTGGESYSRDRFPTIESLYDHVKRLRLSDSAADRREAEYFHFLEAGPKGVEKMIEYAREHKVRSQRRGWMGVKLQSYGFAVEQGAEPAAMYLTQDDFNEAVRSLQESVRIFAETRGVVEAAKSAEDAARGKMDAQKERLDAEHAQYQQVQKTVRDRIEREMRGSYTRRAGEPAEDFASRFKAELNARTVKDDGFIDAQQAHAKELDKFNKLHQDFRDKYRKFDQALEDLTQTGLLMARGGQWEAQGQAYLEALRRAGVPEEIDPVRPDKLSIPGEAKKLSGVQQWRLYVTRDTSITVDERNSLVRVAAKPVFGEQELSVGLGAAQGKTRTVRGEIFAAVMDTDQTLVKIYLDPEAVEKAGEDWALADQMIVLSHEDPQQAHDRIVRERGDGKTVDPNYRLRYYVDPESKLPVMLNRRYMISRLVDSGREKAGVESWAYSPWNWGSLLMEIPRGVLGTPMELLTGRDPNQHNYLGRVHMQKIEGGATNHHGFFRRAVGFIDFLDLMPDPVDWYFDASQFPQQVGIDSPIKPGENIYDKDSRAGKKDIHYGRKYVERTMVYELEDLVNAGKRVRSYFEGGLEDVWLETRRGRDRSVITSRVKESYGRDALEDALDDPMIGSHPNSDGSGRVRIGGIPGHIEVDRIERNVQIRPGAGQYGKIESELSALPDRLSDDLRNQRGSRAGLEQVLAAAERELRDGIGRRRAVGAEERKLWDEIQDLAWKVGRQRAIERAIAGLDKEIGAIRDELGRLRKYLAELERRREEQEGNDPSRPGDPTKWWPWVLFGSLLLSILAAVWEWLTRRRMRQSSPPPPAPALS
ncbi:MAG: hypothetical protein ABIJ96_03390 [Elusimicrobiota bacterium]